MSFTTVHICPYVVNYHLLCSWMFFYIQKDLLYLFTDRSDMCIYKQDYQGLLNVYHSIHLSIRGKPPLIMFIDVLVRIERFVIVNTNFEPKIN